MKWDAPRLLPEPARREIVARLGEWLAGRPEVVFAYLHGSFAEGGPFRDIDLALWVDPTHLDARRRIDYELDLGLALQRHLRLPVDVRCLNDVPLAFGYHATRGHVVLSRDEEARLAWVERTRDLYWDFQPVARRHLIELLHG